MHPAPMHFRDLDPLTRTEMLAELDDDVTHDRLHLGTRLSEQGQRDYESLLRHAIHDGDPVTLAADLNVDGRLSTHETRRTPTGRSTVKAVPVDAATTLAEGEFNRYYIRGVCRRALAASGPDATVTVYRAGDATEPRSASEELIGTTMSVADLLHDLRTNPGKETALGVPGGPNSRISIHV